MNVEIKSAKTTKKEYAEMPFSINSLMGTQFTIEEKLGMTECPRVKTVPTRDGKKTYDVVAIKVSNGSFSKDLHMFDSDWKELCTALPDSIITLEGVALRPNRDQNNPLKTKFEYVGLRTPGNMNDNFPKSAQLAASMEPTPVMPNVLSDLGRQLAQAVQLNLKMGINTDIKTLTKIADAIKPGDALGLIAAARGEGWIYEKDGTYRGE